MCRFRSFSHVLWIVSLLGCSAAPAKRSTDRASHGHVDSYEKISLGEVPQAVQIRGSSTGPILLFLHGGPGNSEMRFGHHYGPFLENRLLVVHWDQRGAGRSFEPRLPKEQLTLARIRSDALELIAVLKERYPKQKILLLGHSWGSIVGLGLVAEHPELFCAYVGMGQFVDGLANMRESFNYVQEASMKNPTVARALSTVGEPPFDQKRFLQFMPYWAKPAVFFMVAPTSRSWERFLRLQEYLSIRSKRRVKVR